MARDNVGPTPRFEAKRRERRSRIRHIVAASPSSSASRSCSPAGHDELSREAEQQVGPAPPRPSCPLVAHSSPDSGRVVGQFESTPASFRIR